MSLRDVLINSVGRRPVTAEGVETVVAEVTARPQPATDKGPKLRARMEAWIAQLNRDPTAEERAAAERRALLLEELNRTVAEVPDDVPIRHVIERLNRHWDD